ncbi:La-related protein [Ooceraea biroi]|uniref:La-related protein 7 n=1 Tax=Ooceraea biroi TaxID=2015173 RepID=A0A026WB72_OOCBI|nr:La-related protein [Ooceraea biroi]
MVMEEQESDMELASERIPVPQVQEPTIDTVKRNNKSSVSRGKPRLRKKALHASIVKQMEFYFGDANLSKDRFLSELLQKNSYVDLKVFTTFNKMRELTMDVNRIAKALQRSTMLKVSEDGTKVCRLTPFTKKENMDECTVYVQNLPPDADHDWLTSIFSKYGPVVYVSIPRYKSNKKIKGFAFIEFDTPNGVKECLKTFQKKGRVLPSHTSPNDLLSITTFDDPKKDRTIVTAINAKAKAVKSKESASNDTENSDNTDANEIDMEKDRPVLRKRKLSSGESLKDNDSKVKRTKIAEDQNADQQDDEKSNVENEEASNKMNNHNKIAGKKRKKVTINDIVEDVDRKIVKKDHSESATKSSNEKEEEMKNLNNSNDMGAVSGTEECPMINSDAEEREIGDEGENEGKKKKRRRNRNKIQQDVICNIGLQVMAKPDWKRLRNRYLELQRSKMRLLKQHLKKAEVGRGEIIIKNRPNYDKFKREKDNEKTNEVEKSIYGCVNYAPGIIIKIEMDEPCTNPRSFKIELKDNNSVKYIDVTDGSCEAYVRCDTAEAAQSFAQKSYEGRRSTILKGDEEKLYWDKIARDREEKLNTKQRVKQRGRVKLLKKAEKELGKCIKFDQD